MNLFLYQGNNYYNRKIIYAESNAEYIAKGFRQLATVTNAAFIVNDGITTSQVINYDYGRGFGDYLVDYDEDDSILSRWWVTKTTVIRNGQVMLTLLRDVIADWYADILSAPAYIKKGGINSPNDPAIFNNESMSFNQIKTWEKPIKDKTACGWYVGYLSKDIDEDQTITIEGVAPSNYDVYSTADEYEFYKYSSANPFKGEFTDITHSMRGWGSSNQWWFGWDNNGEAKNPTTETGSLGLLKWKIVEDGVLKRVEEVSTEPNRGVNIIELAKKNYNDIWLNASAINNWQEMATNMGLANTHSKTVELEAQDGRTIKVGESYYKVVVSSVNHTTSYSPENSSVYTSTILNMVSGISWIGSQPQSLAGKVAEIIYSQKLYTVSLELTEITDLTYTLPANRRHTSEVPYDIFAIPATGCRTTITGGTPTNNELSKKLIGAITSTLVNGASGQLYDVQYVPYCPLGDDFINQYGYVMLNAMSNEDSISHQILRSEDNAGYWTFVIFADQAEFKKRVQAPAISIDNNAQSYKLSNECDMYRLCSPNYNGQFEFSASKNGSVSSWNLSFTYKPYNPYIRVSPNFSRLYGANYGDARGLICGGDFSMTQTNDAWEQYELQNKNYQKIFDRQIENMEVNNRVQRVGDITGAIAGTASGAVSGMAGGAMAGGGVPGAIIGGIAGGITSAGAGVADVLLNEKLRAEAIDYAKDQYGYNLQNIKALPYSLTKVGTQNTDYKIWPFVEYYTCTDTEKEALLNKLEWNGYTIERIGTIDAFLYPDKETFVQGKIIRLEAINAGNNITNVINVELQTGVYFT